MLVRSPRRTRAQAPRPTQYTRTRVPPRPWLHERASRRMIAPPPIGGGHVIATLRLLLRDSKNSRANRVCRCDDLASYYPDIGALPKVANSDICPRLNPQLLQRDPDLSMIEAAVERSDRAMTGRELADPDFRIAVAPYAPALFAERVLIDGHDLRCDQDLAHLIGHGAEIVAGHEWRGEHRPHREVRAALVSGQLAVTDFKHVRVVPVIRSSEGMELGLTIEDRDDARPFGLNVPARAPEMPELTRPFPRARTSPLADRQDDRPPGGAERHGPLCVERTRPHAVGVAPIDLDVVDTPFGEAPRVAELVAEARRQVLTRLCARICVDAETEAKCVDAIGQRLHPPGKLLGIGNEVAIPVALWRHPPIVDDDIAVSGVAHPGRDHGLRGFDHESLVDLHAEPIPAVPTHRWFRSEPVRKPTDPHYGTIATTCPAPS